MYAKIDATAIGQNQAATQGFVALREQLEGREEARLVEGLIEAEEDLLSDQSATPG